MLNVITIMGRLTRDPELRRTPSGVAVTSFSLAVDRDYIPEGQERGTDFIDCVAWRNTAEFIKKYFSKGSMAVVYGRLQVRNYTDKDGNKRRACEINVEHIYFGDSKKKEESVKDEHSEYDAYGQSNEMEDYGSIVGEDKDFPF